MSTEKCRAQMMTRKLEHDQKPNTSEAVASVEDERAPRDEKKKLALRRRGGSAWPGNMSHTALGRECAGMELWHPPLPWSGDNSITW